MSYDVILEVQNMDGLNNYTKAFFSTHHSLVASALLGTVWKNTLN